MNKTPFTEKRALECQVISPSIGRNETPLYTNIDTTVEQVHVFKFITTLLYICNSKPDPVNKIVTINCIFRIGDNMWHFR